jgi:hypothetical protein
MTSCSYTEKELKIMLRDAAKDAVKAALSIQKEAHDEAMQKLVDEQKQEDPLTII